MGWPIYKAPQPVPQKIIWSPAPVTVAVPRPISPLISATQTRQYFKIVSGQDTAPPTTHIINSAGQKITVIKEPV